MDQARTLRDLLARFRPSWPVWVTLAVGLALTALGSVQTHSQVESENRQALATIGAEITQQIVIGVLIAALVGAFLRTRRHALQLAAELAARRQAQQDAGETEGRYRDLFESSPVGLYRSPPQGRYLDVNAAFARILGYASPQQLMAEITDIAAQVYANPGERQILAAVLAERGRALGFEIEARRRDGQPVWISADVSAVRDTAGTIVAYQGAMADITERVRGTLVRDTVSAVARLAVSSVSADGFRQALPALLSTRLGYPIVAVETYDAVRGDMIFVGALGIPAAADAIERLENQAALRERERDYRGLVDNLSAGVLVHAPDTRVRFSNPMASQLLGLDARQLQGLAAVAPPWRFIREDGTPVPQEEYPVARVAASGAPLQNLILGILRADRDDPTWVQCAAHPLRDDQGQLEQIVVTFFDVTKRVPAERALKESQEWLQKNRDLLSEMGRMARVGGWEFNVETGQQTWTETIYDIHELDQACLPTVEQGIAFYTPESRPIIIEAVRRAIDRGEPYDLQLEILTAKGHHRWVHTLGRAVREGGRTIAVSGTFQDITARKEAELELDQHRHRLEALVQIRTQELNEQLARVREQDHQLLHQARLAAMGEMLGNIAHQWRQPLSALALVLGNLQDAERHQELTPQYLAQKIADAHRLIDKMSTTISDFRDFFRPDTAPETFDVSQPVGAALALTAASFKTHGIAVVTDFREAARITGRLNEYSQVIMNLLSNAKDAILARPSNGGQILVRVDRDGEQARVRVTDNGGGIAEAALARLFEPYFSTKPDGTGIGLYMSKMIIEKRMGGRLSACNRETGAQFTVTTPLAPQDQ